MAPMKNVTPPRLELCAAHLLALTLHKFSLLFPHIPSQNILALSDSTIALVWINASPPPHWKVFVGNRVAAILEKVSAFQWFHPPHKTLLNVPQEATPPEVNKPPVIVGRPSLAEVKSSVMALKTSADLSDPVVGAKIRSQ
uniref:Uncharacterized protein n=1 Tax=Rhodnius prolixus TaxID=13249 RepID=T1I3M5_RHOPR